MSVEFCFWTGTFFEGNKEIIFEAPLWKLPVFVKGGGIIPMQKLCQNLDNNSDELILHVYAKGEGFFEFYEDDGITHHYQQGVYSLRKITYAYGCLNITKSNGKTVVDGDQVQIGGNESYTSLCRKHWLKEFEKAKK